LKRLFTTETFRVLNTGFSLPSDAPFRWSLDREAFDIDGGFLTGAVRSLSKQFSR